MISGTIIPAITISKQTKYSTFQIAGFGRTYLHAKMATITIITAVATPCKIATMLRLTPHAESMSATAYKIVTATIVQNEILFKPQTLCLELELDDFELLEEFAIPTSYAIIIRIS